ncbi:hypothetical protein HanRHA438_Chr06g0271611 [Helianthus annuus]|nr:hypothetical protein HanOQP8_Chr06g0223571 [Helianthus annuus]KAJ0912201.1 hypothetical protein HanRHA438_Chr06g0271611 [Helianthus annuus]
MLVYSVGYRNDGHYCFSCDVVLRLYLLGTWLNILRQQFCRYHTSLALCNEFLI